MSLARQLQIVPPDTSGEAPLSPEQARFNALIREIEEARATLAAWQAQIPLFHRAYSKRVEPLIGQLRQARRASIDLVDALLEQPGWTKQEAASLREWLLDRAREFCDEAVAKTDPALDALFARHGGERADSGAPPFSEPNGDDSGDYRTTDDDAASDDAFIRRLEEELAAQAAARDEAKAAAKAARASDAGKKKRKGKRGTADDEQEGDASAQSLRDIFRKLVSVLHPDREPDATRRAEKTVLMQRLNGAYAAQDLLALLELQLQAEQVDASLLRTADQRRLRLYNRALAAQLERARAEIERTQRQFEHDFGLIGGRLLHPGRLDRLIDQAYQELSSVLAEQHFEITMLSDRSATRQWLKGAARQRRW